jgi:hypothetical protein
MFLLFFSFLYGLTYCLNFPALDILLLMDNSYSMETMIDSLITDLELNLLDREADKYNINYAVVTFGREDPRVQLTFTDQIKNLIHVFKSMIFDHQSDKIFLHSLMYSFPPYDGSKKEKNCTLESRICHLEWRESSKKVIILITEKKIFELQKLHDDIYSFFQYLEEIEIIPIGLGIYFSK